uniref:Uncharacterized protein n=1 Tax=Oryza brachyantha TaxID=4533 RepID=J3LVP2_ORYBR
MEGKWRSLRIHISSCTPRHELDAFCGSYSSCASWSSEIEQRNSPCLSWIGAHKAIYFEGWAGVGASAVLRAIAENPGPSLRNKFDRIIHVDCSRALQWMNSSCFLSSMVATSWATTGQPMPTTVGLRFLGLDKCKALPQETGQDKNNTSLALEIFQRLWVLDICYTDWVLVFPQESTEEQQMALNIREVGPQGLLSSLESFSFDSRGDNAEISSISLAGCSRLDLDLSNTIVKSVDFTDKVVQVTCLRRVILLGCELLRAILWPEVGMPQLMLLNITIVGGQEVTKTSLFHGEQQGYCHSYVVVTDMRFFQSLVLRIDGSFRWITSNFSLYLRLSYAIEDNEKLAGSPLDRSITTMTKPICYKDVNLGMVATNPNDSSSPRQLEPLDIHVEIGEGISYANVVSEQALSAVAFVMNKAGSLHVHDNFSITSVNPNHVMLRKDKEIVWRCLQQCHVERCGKLGAVFFADYIDSAFEPLEAFSAADLMMANCIWSARKMTRTKDYRSFAQLRSIQLHCCPRLKYVLPISWAAPYSHLPSLETLYIVRQIFPVEKVALSTISTDHLEFPELKHIYLHEVPKLQQICDTRRMFAPKLKTIRVRKCWGLKRIPSTTGSCPVADCEKDWWEKLEWDGHHPSLFKTCHSKHYKKALPRGSFIW